MNQAFATSRRQAELDLLSVLEVVIARAPKVLKTGVPNLAFFRAANNALAAPDNDTDGSVFTQVEFWLTMARDLGLVANNDGTLEVTTAADSFFAQPAAQRLEALRKAWLQSRDLNEFVLAPELEPPGQRKGKGPDGVSDMPDRQRLADARLELLRFVESLSEPVALNTLLQRLEREARDILISHEDDKSWRQVYYRGIRERGGREDVERNGGWQLVEGAVLRLMLTLPMRALGWLDYDPATAMIAPAIESPAEEPSFEVVVQPNFEVVALGDRPDVSCLWRLARFTTPRPEGRVRTYVLERKPFADALGRGEPAADLVSFVAGLSRAPLPQNVRFSLDDWAALSERIKIWPDALFIEAEGVEDLATSLPARLLEALKPARTIGGHYACPAPDAAVLREVAPPRRPPLDYSRRLPPVVSPGQGTDLVAQRESLHFRARQLIALVSTSTSADKYEIDAKRVAQSAQQLGPEELLKRLREGLARPLTSQLEFAMRTWSGEFGKPFVGEAELLLLENVDQADLLAEQADFKRWVDKRLAPGAFVLRTGGAEKVRALLKALGIESRGR